MVTRLAWSDLASDLVNSMITMVVCLPAAEPGLHGPVKWSYFHLYVIIDIYSRYVVGWLIAERESAALAEKLLADTTGFTNSDAGGL